MASKKDSIRIVEIEDYLLPELRMSEDYSGGSATSQIKKLEAELKKLKGTTKKKMRGGMVKRNTGGKVKKQSGHNKLY